ncbi:unnamed protein product [Brassica rapa]|uniref:KIB1-4 beta-propeller domain-containing protein n=1 Tax=Brassica campestris TaxID=3711 RepID=A0A8D9D393_BRACM|nr:unnamed protein product [Brassica rapa]
MYLITCNNTRGGVSYGFYDPIAKKKTKAMTLPELSMDSKIFCSNDGWLLIKDYSPHGNLCFFNPFTRERINLHFPKHTICSTTFAFTCAPTKMGCLLVGIEGFPDSVSVYTTISTWHPGAVTWVHEEFRNEISSHSRHTQNIIHSDGLFYMATEIALGVFDPSARTWTVLPMQPILGVGPRMRTLRWMTEYAGQIFLVDASYVEPVVFRLNQVESVWEKKSTLDGCSIFVSNGSCVITSGSMSNILYIWNNDINGRRPTKYMCTFKRNRPYNLFFKQEMELSLMGLQNAGKTALINAVDNVGYSEDLDPTVSVLYNFIFKKQEIINTRIYITFLQIGFHMREVTKRNVILKLRDGSGQSGFRSFWEGFCRDNPAIVYVVDAADVDNLFISKKELHKLLSKTSLNGIPLLVLGNKMDEPGALSKDAFTEEMGLQLLSDREVCCFMISCKNYTNIDQVFDWLLSKLKN